MDTALGQQEAFFLASTVRASGALSPVICAVVVLGFATLASSPSHAVNPVTQIHTADFPEGMFALGAGVRFGDSPYVGVDEVGSIIHDYGNDLLPIFYYEGERWFVNGSTGGVHLFQNQSFRFDAILNYRFDRLEPDSDDFFYTVEEREQTFEGGFSTAVTGDWGELSIDWLTDTLDQHNGQEVDLTYRYQWQQGKWALSPFLSLVYQDSKLTDYYYGVSTEESRPDLPTYEPGSAQILRAGINSTWSMSKRMRLFANVSVDGLDSSISDSPLVDEDWIPAAMVGFTYALGGRHDDEAAASTASERGGEWSWRINYGYTLEADMLQALQGDLASEKDLDTNLVGLTLGKLVFDGGRADYWGKVSLNKRLENGYQDDVYEINAYIMAMGTGYSPWTNKELFRFGFGYGLSYAEEVPYVEWFKANNRSEQTSRFLTYLEAQVDVPLRNLFGEGPWYNCYSGLTLVHRSGIFGRVDMIGNVEGGSNVLTAHLECKR
jgi:outer membrane protein